MDPSTKTGTATRTPPSTDLAGGQTPVRGTLRQEYDIYVANASALGWPLKTFTEWLAS